MPANNRTHPTGVYCHWPFFGRYALFVCFLLSTEIRGILSRFWGDFLDMNGNILYRHFGNRKHQVKSPPPSSPVPLPSIAIPYALALQWRNPCPYCTGKHYLLSSPLHPSPSAFWMRGISDEPVNIRAVWVEHYSASSLSPLPPPMASQSISLVPSPMRVSMSQYPCCTRLGSTLAHFTYTVRIAVNVAKLAQSNIQWKRNQDQLVRLQTANLRGFPQKTSTPVLWCLLTFRSWRRWRWPIASHFFCYVVSGINCTGIDCTRII